MGRRGLAKAVKTPTLRQTPEGWFTYERDAEVKALAAQGNEVFGVSPASDCIYDPDIRQRIPKGGAWAMVIRQLPGIEGKLDRHIRVGRIFFLEHANNADDFGFLPDGTYKPMCHSQWGDVHLWPYEYAVQKTDSIMAMYQAGEIKFHPTNMELGRMNDIVHYARSRGIGLADALVMALGTLKGSVGWFEPRRDLAKRMEAMEERVNRWKPSRSAGLGPMEIKLEISEA